ncbi:hypothetical protein AX17_001813 [Amanita inopinata Kibby_2008]|nr:hypothetical protein AX17_001813 [Amanita inopinata Kibby_2008]
MAPESKGVAIITGSERGIGKAIALRLADEGYDVALNDLPHAAESLERLAEEIKQKGRKSIVVTGDISVENNVRDLVEATVQNLGGVDVVSTICSYPGETNLKQQQMIANAATFNGGPFLKTTLDDWERIFAVNVHGAYLCFRYAAEQMVKQGRGGRLLAASSVAGKTGEPYVTAYSSTKWAIRGLVASVAKEFGKHGITANAYAPGIIDTPLWRTVAETLADGFGLQSADDVYEAEKRSNAVGYLGVPEDVANLVSFLVRKESHFVTGQTVSVNGGRFVG